MGGTVLVVPWLRLGASSAEGVGLIPCWVRSHMVWSAVRKFKKKKRNMESRLGTSDIHLSLRRGKW